MVMIIASAAITRRYLIGGLLPTPSHNLQSISHSLLSTTNRRSCWLRARGWYGKLNRPALRNDDICGRMGTVYAAASRSSNRPGGAHAAGQYGGGGLAGIGGRTFRGGQDY